MATQKVTISENQLLITYEGEVIKAKDLLSKNRSILSYDGEYRSASVTNIKSIDKELVTLYGAQGRTIKCSKDTVFLGDNRAVAIPSKDTTDIIKVFRYCPLFGNLNLSKIKLDYLSSSLFNLQDKRPNTHISQTIPLFISKLNRKSLKYLLNYICQKGVIKHLDQQSKDLMIILLSKLGIYFDGQPKHHSSNITGTLKLLKPKTNVRFNKLKSESIGLLEKCTDKALELSFSKRTTPIIGSFLCQTS